MPLSAINYPLSTINYPLSIINYPLFNYENILHRAQLRRTRKGTQQRCTHQAVGIYEATYGFAFGWKTVVLS